MIIHDVTQGSYEWAMLRLGIPTASEFHKIVTPKGKLSSQAKGYAYKLIAERLLMRQIDNIDNLEWVQRGKELEADAVKLYEFETDTKTLAVGFCTTDDKQIGASPDRLAGDEGLLEIKCPKPETHIANMVEGLDADYFPQVQGQLFVTGRKWCDWFSYHPELPAVRIRVQRDEAYIATLSAALDEFITMKEEMMEKIRETGLFEQREAMIDAADKAAFEVMYENFHKAG